MYVPNYRNINNNYNKFSYCRDSAGRRSLRRLMSFEVTDFDANRKSVCDFLLVNNTSLRRTSHRFLVVVLSYSKLSPLTKNASRNALVMFSVTSAKIVMAHNC